MDWPVVFQLHVFYGCRELLDRAFPAQAPQVFHRTTEFDRPIQRRVLCDLALQIREDQRIEVEMIKLDSHLTGKIVTQLNIAVEREESLAETRIGAQVQVYAVSLRFGCKVADLLTIQDQIAKAGLAVNDGCIQRTCAGEMKFGLAFDFDALRHEPMEVLNADAGSGEVETKRFVAWAISGRAAQLCPVMSQENILELRLRPIKTKVRLERPKWLPIGDNAG